MLRNFLILLISVLFLSGCSSKDTQEEITFSSWGSVSEVKILKQVIAEFEKEHSKIKVNFMHVPQNYFQKLHLLFASNTPPDVIFINNHYIPLYSSKLEDITGLISDKDTYFRQAVEGLSYKEKVYAIPRDISCQVFYINLDMFRDKNVPIPAKDWTVDNLLNTGKQLTTNGVWGIGYEDDIYWALPYITAFGGGILTDDAQKEIINLAASQAGLKFYKDLRNKYKVAPKASDIGSSTAAQMFLDQKIAIYLSGRWMYPKISEKADFNWQVAPFPSNNLLCDTSGWAVAKDSKHKEAALSFIKYLSSRKNIEAMTKTGLIVPARIDSIYLLNNNEHNERVFLEVIQTSKKTPVNKNYKKLLDEINRKFIL